MLSWSLLSSHDLLADWSDRCFGEFFFLVRSFDLLSASEGGEEAKIVSKESPL